MAAAPDPHGDERPATPDDRTAVQARPRLICHIIHRLDYGGLENGLVNLINHLPESDYRHAIVCLTQSTAFAERIERGDVEIVEIHKQLGKDPAAYLRVWRALRALRPDIVHTRNLPALDMLAPAALAGVRRLVHGEHGLDVLELDGHNRRYNLLRRLSRLVVRRYVTVSRDLATWLHREVGIPEARISLLYNGVDTVRFQPGAPDPGLLPADFAPTDAFVIGTIGRLEAVKDQLLLAQAFCKLIEIAPDLRARARLIIVGDGSLKPEIEGLLEKAGLRDLAWLPGYQDQAPSCYRCFDAFVLPSRREGISNTILEAMASGLPVIATQVGGNAEIVVDGVTGRMVPPGDADALARALLDYANERDMARRQGASGRERVEQRFSLEAMTRGYQGLYDSL